MFISSLDLSSEFLTQMSNYLLEISSGMFHSISSMSKTLDVPPTDLSRSSQCFRWHLEPGGHLYASPFLLSPFSPPPSPVSPSSTVDLELATALHLVCPHPIPNTIQHPFPPTSVSLPFCPSVLCHTFVKGALSDVKVLVRPRHFYI